MTETINEIVSVAEVPNGLFLLVVTYEEGDGGNGAGLVYRTDGTRDALIEPVLSTNDFLRAMWVSPAGSIWLSSEGGNVWTNANVQWTGRKGADLSFEAFGPPMSWFVSGLPSPQGKRGPPNLGAIWGTDDSNVFAASSNGPIYHWDGKKWRQVHTAAGTIRAFSGSGTHDVIAVGEKGALLHFDGASWRTLKNPDAARPDETFTGACHANGRVYICSQDGRLLSGGMSGLTVLAQTEDIQLRGLAFLGDRLLLAAGQDGVAELQESTLKIIRSTFHSTYIAAGKGRLFFLDASSETAYIEYDPKQLDSPWSYVTF